MALSDILIEISVTTLITVILVFVAALVLGLQIRSIKAKLDEQDSETTKLTQTSKDVSLQIDNVTAIARNNQGQINSLNNSTSNTQNQLNMLNNSLTSTIQSTTRDITDVKTVNLTQSQQMQSMLSGVSKFDALRLGSAFITQEGDQRLNVNNIQNLGLPKNACIQFGNGNTICGTTSAFNNVNTPSDSIYMTGNLNVAGNINNISPQQLQSAITQSQSALSTANMALSKVYAMQEQKH